LTRAAAIFLTLWISLLAGIRTANANLLTTSEERNGIPGTKTTQRTYDRQNLTQTVSLFRRNGADVFFACADNAIEVGTSPSEMILVSKSEVAIRNGLMSTILITIPGPNYNIILPTDAAIAPKQPNTPCEESTTQSD
jgi:hypothetical protein